MKFEYIYLLFYFLTPIAFTIRTVRNAFYLSFLWQIKEYRTDRMLAHLSSSQGKKLLFGPVTLIKWGLLIIILGALLSGYLHESETLLGFGLLGFYAYLLFALIWISEALINIWELVTKGWRIPVFTPKIVSILGIIFLFEFSFLLTIGFSGLIIDHILYGYGPFYDKALAPLISILVVLGNIPSLLYKKLLVMKAGRKISGMKRLIVIGITGSYGKTSTKEFLATILSQKYIVAKTPGSINTDIGIAKYIVEDLKPQHEILIVEMGAYKQGEIAAICSFVNPSIGIITGINEQHLELFGSVRNTMLAKFELIRNLQKNGLAVFNIGNKYVKEMMNWARHERGDIKIINYQKYGIKKKAEIITASEIIVSLQSLSFELNYQNHKISCVTKLAGVQNIDNILAAVAVALKLDLTMEQVKKGIENLYSPTKTMISVGSLGNLKFIDDSFNANPDGAIAALEYVRLITGNKILVLTPLIELGQEADKIHYSLGRKAADICDLILLTNPNYSKPFIKGARRLAGKKKVQIVNTQIGEKIIRQHTKNAGVVIFEGKESGKILEKLLIIKK